MRAHLTSPKFAVVDDDTHVLFFVERALREAFPKSEIATFHDGAEALLHIKSDNTDLLITDHSMARMNGAELIHKLRENGFSLPIIMISSSPDALKEGTAAGATVFMEKLTAMKGLSDVVKSLLQTSN